MGMCAGGGDGKGKDGRKAKELALRIALGSGIRIHHEYEPGDRASCMTELTLATHTLSQQRFR